MHVRHGHEERVHVEERENRETRPTERKRERPSPLPGDELQSIDSVVFGHGRRLTMSLLLEYSILFLISVPQVNSQTWTDRDEADRISMVSYIFEVEFYRQFLGHFPLYTAKHVLSLPLFKE